MRDRLTSVVALLLLAIVTATSFWYAGALRFVEVAAFGDGVSDPTQHTADKNSEGRAEREVHTDGHQHGAGNADEDQGNAKEDARADQRPRHIAANNPLGK